MPRDLEKDLEICRDLEESKKRCWKGQQQKSDYLTKLIVFCEEAQDGWEEAILRAVGAEAKVKELENRIDVLSTVVNMHCSPYYDMMERAEKAEALNKKLLDCLHKVIRQACEDRNGKYDSMCLTAYADAMELLSRFGLLEIRIAYGRSVVAVDKKEQA